jgi:hypothetical protein
MTKKDEVPVGTIAALAATAILLASGALAWIFEQPAKALGLGIGGLIGCGLMFAIFSWLRAKGRLQRRNR